MGEGKQGEITVSFFFFSLSLQLSRAKGDTVRGARSPLLDPNTPPEGEVVLIATFDLRELPPLQIWTWKPPVLLRPCSARCVPGHSQDDGVCQALQTGTCQVCLVPAQTGHWDPH